MTRRRYELSDFEWSIIQPLLPNNPRGVARADDRKVLNCIYWRLRRGRMGRYSGALRAAHDLFQPLSAMREKIGVWDRLFEAVSSAYDGDLQMIDSSSIRVHQHGGNVKKGVRTHRRPLGTHSGTQCMGRSRGGLTTKIHALVDANGRPVRLQLTEGQAHDGRSAADMLDSVGAGQTLLADRAYDSDLLRQRMADRGAWANIKPVNRRLAVPPFSRFL